jgi:nucleoid DNA-binding protein
MLPKNNKHFLQPTSEKLDLNLTLVEDVVSFYYTELRKALSNLECHNIQVEGLGSFKIKNKELPKLVKKYENHLNVLKPETFNQMAIKKDIEEKLYKVFKAQELIENDLKRKQEFYKNKKNGHKKNMEE